MALNISSLSAALAPNSAAQLAELVRTNAMHYSPGGAPNDPATDQLDGLSADAFSIAGLAGAGKTGTAAARAAGATQAPSFENALLKALDGVSASQGKSDNLLQQVVANPNSVDAQDVTIAMAEANMSLNLAKTILSRVVTAWKDVINTR
jgi:flagellar hook-basal body complex protein FliE